MRRRSFPGRSFCTTGTWPGGCIPVEFGDFRFMRKQEENMGECRFVSRPLVKAFGFALSLMFFLMPRLATAQNEWLTWGHDPERTGSNPDEKILNKDNVSQLEVKWTARISTAPKDYVLSTMTAPLVATLNTPQGPAARVFVVGSDNTLF